MNPPLSPPYVSLTTLHISPTASSTSSNVTPGLSFTVLNSILAPNGIVIGPNMSSSCTRRAASGARGREIQCDVISIALDSPASAVGQDTFQKTVQGLQIVQAAFLFYWDQGEILSECPCEKADSVVRFKVLVKERNLRDAATR